MNSTLTLIGAGPGDPELITLKGVRALQQANVVLYDALVHPDLLQYTPGNAEKIYVGKRAGAHSFRQEEINQMIVGYARRHEHIVRLKGGDPLVFARGYEEIAYAQLFGMETKIVPGISSVVAVPGLQQVPLTCRGINESFWVLTATTRSGKLSEEVELAARSTATAVILMGMRKLELITELFAQHGKANTPAMIVQNSSLPEEKVVLGTVSTLLDLVQAHGIGRPGTIVIGDVVRLHPQYPSEERGEKREVRQGKLKVKSEELIVNSQRKMNLTCNPKGHYPAR